jgi:Mg-chelatase subunit ChlD
MNPQLPQLPHNDPESRLTALILGELPPDDAAALQAELASNPALAELHRRLQETIGLLREAVKSPEAQNVAAAPAQTLAPERRAALLASFKVIPTQRLQAARPQRNLAWREISALAAMLLALLILASVFLSFLVGARYKMETRLVGLAASESDDINGLGFSAGEKAKAKAQRIRGDTLTVAQDSPPPEPATRTLSWEEAREESKTRAADVNAAVESSVRRESLAESDPRRSVTLPAPQAPAPERKLQGSNYVAYLWSAQPSAGVSAHRFNDGDASTVGTSSGTTASVVNGIGDPVTLNFAFDRKRAFFEVAPVAKPEGQTKNAPTDLAVKVPELARPMGERLGEAEGLDAAGKAPVIAGGAPPAGVPLAPPPPVSSPIPSQLDTDSAVRSRELAGVYEKHVQELDLSRGAEAEKNSEFRSKLLLGENVAPTAPPIEPATGLPIDALNRVELQNESLGRKPASRPEPGPSQVGGYAANGPNTREQQIAQRARDGQEWAGVLPQIVNEAQRQTGVGGAGRGGGGGGRGGGGIGGSLAGQQPPVMDQLRDNLALGDGAKAAGQEASNFGGVAINWKSQDVAQELKEKAKAETSLDRLGVVVNAPAEAHKENAERDEKKLAALQDVEAKPAAGLPPIIVSEINAQPEKQLEDLAKRVSGKDGIDNSGEELLLKRRATAAVPQPEVPARENPFSTFSLNVSDVSFKLAAASLENGKLPDAATIRTEEFINAFDYRDPEPRGSAPVSFTYERARYPFAHNRDVVRFALKTAASGRQPGRPLNLVLLLDNSGSMERADRVQIIRECLRVLATQLRPEDRVSVVTFARTSRLWIDGMPGNQASELAPRVGGLTPQGGTNLEDALNLAYQTALRHFQANGMNRVVLLTDGAANLGEVDPAALKRKVEAQRKQGIALDCFGIGWEGYNDDLLETLSRNADGRYGFINTPEAAATEFAGQLAGALQVAASDVKVQVEFNPRRVTVYRQLGYAKHQLTKEQFRDNTVDAAELASAEAGNALYLLEVNPQGEGPLGVVRVRFKVPGTSDYREHEWAVPYDNASAALEQSSPSLRLAASSAAFAEWLTGSPFAGEVNPDRLLRLMSQVPERYANDPRPKKLEWMLRQAKAIAK